jgi:ferrous iron transport protein B
VHLDVVQPGAPTRGRAVVALVGNPNAGKTTLFNALTGLHAKTANFPGTTIERRLGRMALGERTVELLDLPGLYSLTAATMEERVAADALLGRAPGSGKPTAVVLLLDATNLERNLFLASQVLELGLPTVVALNMIDLAHAEGIRIQPEKLARELGCPVVPTAARTGHGIERLKAQIELIVRNPERAPRPKAAACGGGCGGGCPFQARYNWAEKIGAACSSGRPATHGQRTERIDRVLTHPVVGVAAFLAIMVVVFTMIFWVARFPMALIEWIFDTCGRYLGSGLTHVAHMLHPGLLRGAIEYDLTSLLTQGVLSGVGGVLVFLPQICILFFFLSLLEDTGYLARAAFVMDRLMRRVGLPGKAFVPMLSAHACAVPAIMAARVIDDKRDRLVTMLVLPFMSCSARIPVYTMLVALLFPGAAWKAGLVFTGAYLLGIVAALVMALVFKRTILPGETRPLVLELPSYKMPSLRTALLTMLDRARLFVTKAGTVILLVSVILWALSYYPHSAPPPAAVALGAQAGQLAAAGQAGPAAELRDQATRLTRQNSLQHSFAGHIGRAIEPALRPLGYDWQLGIGILSSFAAREVFVSTLSVVYGMGEDAANDNPQSLYATMAKVTRSDGTPMFTAAVCLSLLVFYVLAMQCASTLAVTRRETGGWGWPAFQFAYMSVLAYGGALLTYQIVMRL